MGTRTHDAQCPTATQPHKNLLKVGGSYCKDFSAEADVVLPGYTEHIRQVEREVDDSSTGGGEVSSSERCAEEETLHDGHHGE